MEMKGYNKVLKKQGYYYFVHEMFVQKILLLYFTSFNTGKYNSGWQLKRNFVITDIVWSHADVELFE